MRRRNFSLIILILAVVVYFSESIIPVDAQSPPNCTDTVCTIIIGDNFFQPNNITIRPPNSVTGGSVKVIWINNGFVTHTVTSGMRNSPNPVFDSGNLGHGQTFNLTINQTVYDQLIFQYGSSVPYHCKIHLGMDATLNITGDPIPEYSLSTFVLTLALTSIIVSAILVRFKNH